MKIFAEKNHDYGSSYDVDGVVGIVIRLGDKLKRLKTISQHGHVIAVTGEGLTNLLLDIANYCDIGLMLMEREYGKAKEAADCCNESKLIQQGEDYNKFIALGSGAISPIGE